MQMNFQQQQMMYANYNQNMQVNKEGNNFMYMPNYTFTP